ncbi:MAG: FAD/NAD(P)-binding protein [Candidatus Latescibacter sp.]|nr:FAD/NAD(P)-binding protein [Candidatus Latescibacter sp.]
MSDLNPYMPLEGVVERIIVETPTIKTLVVRPAREIPFIAGQFMQLTVPGVGEGPFTPSSSPNRLQTLEFTILRAGTVTEALHALNEGDNVGLRGPFGKGYPVDKLKGKEVLVIGGGCGLAPLRSLLFVLFDTIDQYKKVSIKYGAKSPGDLVYRSSYEQWNAIDKVTFTNTVDTGAPGWIDRVGVVTTILDDLDVSIPDSYAVMCGPEIMLKFVTMKLLGIGYKPEQIYISMNRRMSCGTGKCGRCNVGPYYLCKDGPDMNYALIKDYPNVFGS